MSNSSTVTLKLLADTKNIVEGVNKTNEKLGSLNSTADRAVSGVKKLAAGFFAFKAVEVVGEMFKEASAKVEENQQLLAQTNAVLKSTSGAAGVTADSIVKLSESIEGKSTLDKSAIQSGANLLLTFTNLKNEAGKGNDIFNQTTQVMADMSTALGQDTKSSAIQLGKALNDPIHGLTALQRVGVSFTEDQKKQIKTLQDSGNTMGAQKVILAELSKEFGGSAAAAGNTFAGKMLHVKESIQEVLEKIITVALPTLTKLADFVVTKVVPAIQSFGDWLGRNKAIITPLAVAIGAMVAVIGTWMAITKAMALVQAALNAVLAINPFVLIIAGLAALVVGLIYAWNHSKTFRDIVIGVWNAIKGAVLAVLHWFTGTLWPGIQKVYDFIVNGVKTVFGIYVGVWSSIIGFVASVPGRIMGFFSGIAGWFGRVWTNIKDGAVTGFQNVVSFIAGLPGKILSALGSIGSLLLNVGKDLLTGLWNGIEGAAGWLLGKVEGFFKDLVPGWIRSALGINSPSKVTAEIGAFVTHGFAQGILDPYAMNRVKDAVGQLNGAVTGGLNPSPSFATGVGGRGPVYNITVNALNADANTGRMIMQSINEYNRLGGR